jgi:hypothetical protein
MTGIQKENECGGHKINLSGSGYWPMVYSFEHGNKTSCFIQSKLFVEGVSEC